MKYLLNLLFLGLGLSSHAQIDSLIGRNAPKKISQDYKTLAHYICDSVDTDYEKVNAIYNWVTYNIAYDVKSVQHAKLRTDKPNEVLKRRKTICGGYADLITAMCKEMGIRAQTITGYYKNHEFDEGDKFFKPNHAWNAVMINNQWEYIDATAGAGFITLAPNWFQRLKGQLNKKKLYTANKPKFVQEYDTETFLPDVEEFKLERMPADLLWQLTDTTMPLNVFEAGDKSVKTFNKNVSTPIRFSIALSDINKLDDHEQILECADRTYAYNPRFTSMLAHKKYVETTIDIVKAINEDNKTQGRVLLTEAKKELQKTKDIQLEQKQAIVKEMTFLKQKNKEKTAVFKKYQLRLDKDNKKKKTALRTRKKQAETTLKLISKKRNDLKKKPAPNSIQNIEGIKTIKPVKDISSPDLVRLADSITQRTQRIEGMKQLFNEKKNIIESLSQNNKNLIEEVIQYYNRCDSLLYTETKARFKMHDDYDSEVKIPQAKVTSTRFDQLNPTLDAFFKSYDSLKKVYEAVLKLNTQQEQTYKTNFKNIEQYKKQNDENKAIVGKYNTQIIASQAVRQNYIALLNDYDAAMRQNIALFDVLTKAHDRELEYTRLMNMAEEKRNELEGKQIKKDDEWLKAENKKVNKLLTSTKKEADKLFKLRHSKNEKRWEKELKKLEAKAKAQE